MEQYIKFHQGEYQTKASEKNTVIGLFHDFFAKSNNCFVYGPYEQGALMLLETKDADKYFFTRGLSFALNEIKRYPIEYAFKLSSDLSEDEKTPKKDLNPGALPSLGRQVLTSAALKNINMGLLAKLFDAIVFNETRPILLIDDTENLSVAQDYIKAISLLLPTECAQKTGFCLGCEKMTAKAIQVIEPTTRTKYNLSIKIWVPKMANLNISNYSRDYYFFNLRDYTSNYTNELSPTAVSISGLKLRDIDEFINDDEIRSAFDSNPVDLARLNIASMIYSYVRGGVSDEQFLMFAKNQEESAISNELTAYLRYPCEEAINKILEKANLDPSDNGYVPEDAIRDCLVYFCKKTIEEMDIDAFVGPDANSNPANKFLSFYKNQRDFLNEGERAVLDTLIISDKSGERLFLYANEINPIEQLTTLIHYGSLIIGTLINDGLLDVHGHSDFIRELCNQTSINNYISTEPAHINDVVKKLTDIPNVMVQSALCAILLAPTYQEGEENNPGRKIRIQELTSFLNKKFTSPKQKLDFVLNTYNVINDILWLFNDTPIGFVLSTKNGSGKWVRDIVDSLDIQDLLDAENRISLQEGSHFSELLAIIRARLIQDTSFLDANIHLGSELWNTYNSFFDKLSEKPQNIRGYLNDKSNELVVNDSLANSRYNFALDCYKTLSRTDKGKVKQSIAQWSINEEFDTPTFNFEELRIPSNRRIQVVEAIIDTFGKGSEVKKLHKSELKPIGILSAIFAIASFLILCIPSVAIPLIIGNASFFGIIDHFVNFFLPIFAFVPIIVFLSYLLIYMCSKEKNASLRIQKANLNTFLCCLLPLLCFVIAYIAYYFIGAIPSNIF